MSVTRQTGSAGAVTVNYSTADGTAVQGTDYDFTQGTLTWEDGDAQPKMVTVKLLQSDTAGTKQFALKLSSPSDHASLGSPSASTVTVVGTLVTKSISEWVKCDSTDDSTGMAAALAAAKNNAFILVFDCPIKVHFTGKVAKTLNLEDGTTVEFQGDGALTIDNLTPAPLQVAAGATVSFVNWNVGYPS